MTGAKKRFALGLVPGVALAAVAACATNPSLGSADSTDPDAGSLVGAKDAGGNVVVQDGAANLPAIDSGPAQPLSSPDAASTIDSGGAAASDASVSSACDNLLSAMLASPITPPAGYAGLNLAGGSNPSGLTIDEANTLGCATIDNTLHPGSGGYRSASWGVNQDVTATFNVESRVLYSLSLANTYKGEVTFQSRVNGSFGQHTYNIGIGHVLRDGVSMPIDWSAPDPWANELYDGLIATFSPSEAPTPPAGCAVSGACLIVANDGDGTGTALFGMRPLAFYIQIAMGTNQPIGFYSFWNGGKANCSTPVAALEAMDNAFIEPEFAGATPTSPPLAGSSIGGLDLMKPQPNGLTWQGANSIVCNGTMLPNGDAGAGDGGTGLIAWGPTNELQLEYDPATSIGYRVTASAGYKGVLQEYLGTDTYNVGIGTLTKDGAPFTIDWAAPNASVTELSNAVGGLTDTDCVAASDCTITADDGQGHSVIAFPRSDITVTLAQGTSVPQSIYTVWPNTP